MKYNDSVILSVTKWSRRISFVITISALLLVACSDFGERDNPLDPAADNYVEPEEESSSSLSSSSAYIYVKNSSSSTKKSGSSSSGKSSSSAKSSSDSKNPDSISYGELKDSRDGKNYKTIVI